MLQYLRKVRATFNNGAYIVNPGNIVRQVELKINFSVTKGLSGSANTAEITLYNLAPQHRNAIGKELSEIMLEAGYIPPVGLTATPEGFRLNTLISSSIGTQGNVGIIFSGQIRDVYHTREDADILTKISCGDGDKALRKSTISKTFQKGTTVGQVIEDLEKEFEKQGIKKGEWKFPEGVENKQFKRPYSICGSCEREMNTLGRSNGFYWSIQNGAHEIVPGDSYLSGGAVEISAKTGMIEVPTITDNGIEVRALLNPQVRPGRLIKVVSDVIEMNAANSLYRAGNVTYEGDNWDDDAFYVSIHGEAVGGSGKVDEGQK